MVAVTFEPERRLLFSVICVLAFAAILALNRRYARKKLQPRLDSVNQLIEEAR